MVKNGKWDIFCDKLGPTCFCKRLKKGHRKLFWMKFNFLV